MSSSADHDKIRSLIEAEILEVAATIASLEKALEPRESDCGIGRMVSPDSQPDTQTAEVALRLATKRLEKLRQATQRLNQPDFDKCRLCQKTIPYERLLLVPETKLCVHCSGHLRE